MKTRKSILHNSLEVSIPQIENLSKPSVRSGGHIASIDEEPSNFESLKRNKTEIVGYGLQSPGGQTIIDEDFGSSVYLGKNSQLGMAPIMAPIKKATGKSVLTAEAEKKSESMRVTEIGDTGWTMTVWVKRMDAIPLQLKLPWLINGDAVATRIESQKLLNWEHWAFVHKENETGKIHIYQSGREIKFDNPQPTIKVNPNQLKTIFDVQGDGGLALAQFNMYDKELLEHEILEELELDRSGSFPFLDVAPLQFQIVDSESFRSVLNIDRYETPQSFEWEAQNRTPLGLSVIPATRNLIPGANNYHFALEFRPGTFTDGQNQQPDLTPVSFPGEAADWRWQVTNYGSEDTPLQVIYYLYVGAGMAVLKDESLRFQIKYHSAVAPSRGTRVFLRYDQLEQGDGQSRKIMGSSLQRLTITDFIPKISPIQARIVGNHSILNSGTDANEILIRIENVVDHPISFDADSSISLTFDAGDGLFALANQNMLANISVKFAARLDSASWGDAVKNTDSGVRFSIKPADKRIFSADQIPVREGFFVKISNIRTNGTAGAANLYLSFRNFPEILGDDQTLKVEKSPIFFKTDSAGGSTNTGIGKIPGNGYTLDIKGKSRVQDLEIEGKMVTASGLTLPNLIVDDTIGGTDLRIFTKVLNAQEDIYGQRLKIFEKIEASYVDALSFTGKKIRIAGSKEGEGQISAGDIQIGNGKNNDGRVKITTNGWGRVGSESGLAFWANGKVDKDDVPAMHIHADHGVTIGTDLSTRKGLLNILGNRQTKIGKFAFYAVSKKDNDQFTGWNKDNEEISISLYCNERVVAGEFNAPSDCRTKVIEGLSNNQQDLQALLEIEITDYHLIDQLVDNRSHKKVIAQQVEAVFPAAISKIKEVVPDIFQTAFIENGYIAIGNTLRAGDRIRLVFPDKTLLTDVIDADSEGFTVNLSMTGEVFVYGREVDDFQIVDYNAISMLNVSATQELHRNLQSVQQENEQLKTRQIEMEQKINALEARLMVFETLLNSMHLQPITH